MPAPNGLEVAARIAGRCHIVFVTAYETHAVDAFERGAVDYLLKPVNPDRLAVTIVRLKQRMQAPPDLERLASLLSTIQLEGGQATNRFKSRRRSRSRRSKSVDSCKSLARRS